MTTTPDDLRVAAAARLDDAATDALLEAVDGADDEKVRALVDALGPSRGARSASEKGRAEAARRFGSQGAS